MYTWLTTSPRRCTWCTRVEVWCCQVSKDAVCWRWSHVSTHGLLSPMHKDPRQHKNNGQCPSPLSTSRSDVKYLYPASGFELHFKLNLRRPALLRSDAFPLSDASFQISSTSPRLSRPSCPSSPRFCPFFLTKRTRWLTLWQFDASSLPLVAVGWCFIVPARLHSGCHPRGRCRDDITLSHHCRRRQPGTDSS